MKRFFFGIGLVLTSNGTLLAATFDGDWTGTFECAASPTDPAKVPAYSTSFTLTVSGAAASGSRVAPNMSEVLNGTVEPQGSLRLSGTGQRKSGEGQPWTTTISGNFTGDKFAGSGGIFGSDGRQARKCAVSLTHLGQAQSAVAPVETGGSVGAPKQREQTKEQLAKVIPITNGLPSLPDEMLMAKRGLPWAYIILPSPTPAPVTRRVPTPSEQTVIERARFLLNNRPAKAIALLDGPNLVYLEYNAPANDDSLFQSQSMAKTVTAMAVGQAICAGKLKLTDRTGDIIPEVHGTALGSATVRDLLRMASGTGKPENPGNSFTGNIFSDQDFKDWMTGNIDLVKVLAHGDVSKAAKGAFSDYRPGEVFSYKGADPMALGIMLNRVTGMPYAKWVQKTIFDPMGAAGSGWIAQNKLQQAKADAGVQLRMEDWIRFAWWVKQASLRTDCFGGFVKDAMHTQIATGRKATKGYGYLTWTDSVDAPNTAWAWGYGGQRIGWSHDNNRMLIAFSNREDWMPDLATLLRDWKDAAK
jgi:CubicO group peptidase (beta-lactamase class C family)